MLGSPRSVFPEVTRNSHTGFCTAQLVVRTEYNSRPVLVGLFAFAYLNEALPSRKLSRAWCLNACYSG